MIYNTSYNVYIDTYTVIPVFDYQYKTLIQISSHIQWDRANFDQFSKLVLCGQMAMNEIWLRENLYQKNQHFTYTTSEYNHMK